MCIDDLLQDISIHNKDVQYNIPLCIRTSDHSTTRESRNNSPMLYTAGLTKTRTRHREFKAGILYTISTEYNARQV